MDISQDPLVQKSPKINDFWRKNGQKTWKNVRFRPRRPKIVGFDHFPGPTGPRPEKPKNPKIRYFINPSQFIEFSEKKSISSSKKPDSGQKWPLHAAVEAIDPCFLRNPKTEAALDRPYHQVCSALRILSPPLWWEFCEKTCFFHFFRFFSGFFGFPGNPGNLTPDQGVPDPRKPSIFSINPLPSRFFHFFWRNPRILTKNRGKSKKTGPANKKLKNFNFFTRT